MRISNPKKGTVSIKFELINNLVVVPVKINNSDTLKFILDTGAGRTVITELGVDQEFEIEYNDDISLIGLGESGPVAGLISENNNIFLSGIEGESHTVVFILDGNINLSSFMGTQVNGLLGYDIFENFIVEIDYEKTRLYLHDPDNFKKKFESLKRKKDWNEVSLQIENNKIYTVARLEQTDDSEIDAKLLIDSGASHTIFLYPTSSEDVILPSKTIQSYLGTGLSGEIHGEIGKIKKINFGGVDLNEPVIYYPDSSGIKNLIGREQRNGSIGSDLLKKFNTIYNYSDSTLLISKNKNFKQEITYNSTGIDISTPFLNLPFYEISRVRKNSPADKVGLQERDVIVEINNNKVYKYSLNELLEILQGPPGKLVNFKIKRDNRYMFIELKIEDEIEL